MKGRKTKRGTLRDELRFVFFHLLGTGAHSAVGTEVACPGGVGSISGQKQAYKGCLPVIVTMIACSLHSWSSVCFPWGACWLLVSAQCLVEHPSCSPFVGWGGNLLLSHSMFVCFPNRVEEIIKKKWHLLPICSRDRSSRLSTALDSNAPRLASLAPALWFGRHREAPENKVKRWVP
jgi:hypothetical protein